MASHPGKKANDFSTRGPELISTLVPGMAAVHGQIQGEGVKGDG